MHNTEQEMMVRARHLLEVRDAEIDDGTLDTLARARRAALASIQSPKPRRTTWIMGALTATATIALVAFFVSSPTQDKATLPDQDLELLSKVSDLDMLDDYEFYQWLKQQHLPG